MPNTPPLQARRGSLRTRINAPTIGSTPSPASTSKPGPATQTRAQQQQNVPLSTRRTLLQQNNSVKGRVRKESLNDDLEKSRKGIGRLSRTRDPSTEGSTEPATEHSVEPPAEHSVEPSAEPSAEPSTPPGLSYMERDTLSPSPSNNKDVKMDLDLEDSSQNASRRSNTQRHVTRQQSMNISKQEESSNSRRVDETTNRDREQESQDREGEGVSSDSEPEDGDAESDTDHRGPAKEKKPGSTSRAPRRRLRSSKMIPSATAQLVAESNGLTLDQIMDEYNEDQQQLRADTSAAEALTRLFRQGILDSESLHPDMVDPQDYELIRHTFGGEDLRNPSSYEWTVLLKVGWCFMK